MKIGTQSFIHCRYLQAATAEEAVAQYFHVSTEVSTLSVALFVLGLGIGPMLTGPLAEAIGQQYLYLGSFFFMWGLTWPIAFADNLGEYFMCLNSLRIFNVSVSRASYLSLSQWFLRLGVPQYRWCNDFKLVHRTNCRHVSLTLSCHVVLLITL